MTRADKLAPLYADRPGRIAGDRLELLTTLISGPRFDPVFRGDIVRFPPEHPAYRWRCLVRGCQRVCSYTNGNDMCHEHVRQWRQVRAAGTSRAGFLVTAEPLETAIWMGQVLCRVCPGRPATSTELRLCKRHLSRWQNAAGKNPALLLDLWCSGEVAFDGYGGCAVIACSDLAVSPLGLCRWHELAYGKHGRPGNARLPGAWIRDYETPGKPVPVTCDHRPDFRRWCVIAPARSIHGQIDLRGLRPLMKAELQWGLFRHTSGDHSRWVLSWVQSLVNTCRQGQLDSLADLDVDGCNDFSRLIAREILHELRLVYFAPAGTRDAGFLETEHFGVRFPHRAGHFSLTAVSQRWLRDLLWDFLAGWLRSPNCPATAASFDRMRLAVVELSAFLEAETPQGGHDPTVLRDEHMHRFIADHRHRERHSLPSLGIYRNDGQPSTVTPMTRAHVFGGIRRLLRSTLETGEADHIGLDRGFIVAAPCAGFQPARTRRPFPDHVARALADEANLTQFAGTYDSQDIGLRDVWETLIATGRRLGEVTSLRLDCTGRYNGLPLLWHDQTKVGNYDEAIRIPETICQLLAERRRKTVERFVQRHGRQPTTEERPALALFPTRMRNPSGTTAISTSTFHKQFRDWVDQLELGGSYVSHQARHTLATNLLRHGAGLHHIRRYLGHVSERMTEYYAKVALSEIEDVLQHVWVAGPAAPHPGEVLSAGGRQMSQQETEALVLDLSRRSTPAEGGFCTFQPVVQGGACPWNLDCHNCQNFVLSGADLLYWRRKREQWTSIAERAPDDATADYLHKVFEPTARAIDGLEKALAAVGLLHDALALDLRRPQDYFNRVWSTAFRATGLATHHTDGGEAASEETSA
jgi:integrase